MLVPNVNGVWKAHLHPVNIVSLEQSQRKSMGKYNGGPLNSGEVQLSRPPVVALMANSHIKVHRP